MSSLGNKIFSRAAADFDKKQKARQPIVWQPQRGSQHAFFAATPLVFELLYGGAAGGGKSEAIIIDAARDIQYSDYKAIIFRRTYPELEKSLVPRCYELYSGMGGQVKNKGMDWTFPSGAKIYLSHLQREEDKEKHKSSEYDAIYFDELTSFTESQYIYLFSRCRGTNPIISRRVRSATNPTGIGHSWVKKRFLEKDPTASKLVGHIEYEKAVGWRVDSTSYDKFELLPENYEKGDPVFVPDEYPVFKDLKSETTFAFIPSLIWNNERLLRNDPSYVKRLLLLPEKHRLALLYGSWDAFEGQFFSEWDPAIHVVEPFEIPKHWKRYVAVDYGFAAPFAVLWFALDPCGVAYAYRELYARKLPASDQGEAILDLSKDEEIEWSACDPAMFSKTGSGESIAQMYDRAGLTLFPSSNKRLAGWAIMHEYLSQGKLKFFSSCVNSIRTIPSLNHKSIENPEDLDTTQEDHLADVTRYFLLTLRGEHSQVPSDPLEPPQPQWWGDVKHKMCYSRNRSLRPVRF